MGAGNARSPLAHNDDLRRGVFRLARVGIFPRSSLLGAGRWGSGIWEGWVNWVKGGQTGSVYKQPERKVDDSYHIWRVPSK
jgi:hypothetical protein